MALSFDYVVIGAGSAGCVLANRLSASGQHRVLLVEAGGRDRNPWIHVPIGYGRTMFDRDLNWMLETDPEPQLQGRRIKVPRGRVLGGSSAINGMIYTRGHRQDFDDWRDSGNPGWGYDDCLPYFRKAERFARGADHWHGGDGPLRVRDFPRQHALVEALISAGQALGLAHAADFNVDRPEGVGYFQGTIHRGRRCSSATAYLRAAEKRTNLEVWTRATALRIVFAEARARGVVVRHGDTAHAVDVQREVLLCAGSIHSPQLLQLSGVGSAELLRRHGIPVVRDLPGVGENFHDHLQARFVFECREPITVNDDLASLWGRARIGLQYLLARRGPMSWPAGIGGGFIRSAIEVTRPDLQLHLFPFSTDRVDPRLHDFSGFTLSVCQLQPRSRGSVTIRGADPDLAPAIRANFLDCADDVRVMLAGLLWVRRLAATPAFARIVRMERDPGPECRDESQLVDFLRAKSSTVFHPSGTCRMGRDALAVVDHELRVHGVDGLRVVDGSIMPTVTSGNTNAPIVMIAEKAADLIMRAGQAQPLRVAADPTAKSERLNAPRLLPR